MRSIFFLLLALTAVGCRSLPPRNPVPQHVAGDSVISGIPGARAWGDELPDLYRTPLTMEYAELKKTYPAWVDSSHTYLALSGGGPMGAYGAGVLTGMSENGHRPEFLVVIGISAGALIAPFAFLGTDYDPVLRQVFTTSHTDDILKLRGPFSVLTLDAFANSAPLKAQIDRYITRELMQKIAQEHRRGRRLLIGTTNMDTERPVIWNLGAIAQADSPEALSLIRNILLASASIPGAFPPVLFQVEVEGRPYDELHADGGMTNTIFLYPSQIDWDEYLAKLKMETPPTLYLIQNMFVEPSWKPTERKTMPIAIRGFMSMLRSQGIGDLHRIATLAERDGIQIRLGYIPSDFTETPAEIFDPEWMTQLFEIGREFGRKDVWKSPDLLLPDAEEP